MNLSKQLRAVRVYSFTSCLRLTDAVWVALLAAGALRWRRSVWPKLFSTSPVCCARYPAAWPLTCWGGG